MSDPKSLDDHLATINDILSISGIASKFPDPPESVVHYRAPPGTFDGAMDLKPNIDMSKFGMPIVGQERTPRPALPPPHPADMILGGRGMPTMMPSSPPDQGEGGATPLITYPGGRTSEDSQTTPYTGGSPATPGTWGTSDRAALPHWQPQPETGGTDILSLLRGMFQGAL
jgi:hypothetical protein